MDTLLTILIGAAIVSISLVAAFVSLIFASTVALLIWIIREEWGLGDF
jgi:hypothetical protein